MVTWLRIHLPMQGTWVRALVREDPTCRRAMKPVCHNYWSPHAKSPCSTTRGAATMRSLHTATKSSSCSPQLEKACTQQQRPNTAKNKYIKKKKIRSPLLKKKEERKDPIWSQICSSLLQFLLPSGENSVCWLLTIASCSCKYFAYKKLT